MTTTPLSPASPSLIATLPGHYYTDPEVFRQEQRHVFEAMWFCAVRGADLDRPGAFRTVQVGRGERPRHPYPRGRAAGLPQHLPASRGPAVHAGVRAGAPRLQCPYHAWTYDLDGRLVAAPNLTKMPDVDRSAYGLVAVALREWLGYAWVCLADTPPSFEETVMGAAVERLGDAAAIERYGTERLALGRRMTYDVRANWKLIVENFMECYHCATIHPELTDVLPEFADGYAAQYYVGHGAEFGEEVKGFTVDGSEGFGRLPEVANDQDRRYYAVTIKPTVFVNLVPDHVILHRMFPFAEDRTVVECDWLYAPEVVASGADVSKSVELFHRVNTQDLEACERTQPAMASRAYRSGGVLVPTEHHIGIFHEWLLERLGGRDDRDLSPRRVTVRGAGTCASP